MANRIQYRRDTAANWKAANPVLALGEPALETDTKLRKIGDGVTAWNSLGYQAPDKKTLDATYAKTVRPNTLASLGDSIATNGSIGMAVSSLVTAVAAGATSITVTAPEQISTFTSDCPSDTLIRIGNEYSRTTGAPVASGANWTVTLTAALTSAHAAGERFMTLPTVYTGTPPPALVAVLASKGQLSWAGNYGHGGYTVDQLYRIYLPLVIAAKPGYCYVMAGTNVTAGDTPAQNAARVASIWDALIAAGITPIATTLPPVNDTATVQQTKQRTNECLLTEARKRGIPVDDLYGRLVDPATGNYATGMNADTVHPSEAGRWIQGNGIWTTLQPILAPAPGFKPTTNAYGETALHPVPASQNNALMLTGGGYSGGAGTTSVTPLNWQTGAVDANGIVSTPAAPTGNGKAIKLAYAAGATTATAVNSSPTTITQGHRYLLTIDITTTGLSAAYAATPTMPGLRIAATDSPSGGTGTFLNMFSVRQDFTGTLTIPFVCTAAQPTGFQVYASVNGLAGTPAYSVTIWNVDVLDLTALGQESVSPWPYQGAA